MSSQMISHVALSVEFQLTHWACEGFLACMNTHVSHHVSLIREKFPAGPTSKIKSEMFGQSVTLHLIVPSE